MNEQKTETERLSALEAHVMMLDRLLAEKIIAAERATELHVADYTRRIDELYRTQQQIMENLGQLVRKESCEATHCLMQPWRKEVSDELAETRGQAKTWVLVMGVAVSLLAVVIHFIK